MALRPRPPATAGSPRDHRAPGEIRRASRPAPRPGDPADRPTGAAPEDKRASARPGPPESPDGAPAPSLERDGQGWERRAFGWWRARSWRADLAVLARVRNGLQALPDAEPAADDAAAAEPQATVPSQPHRPAEAPAPDPANEPDPAIVGIGETSARVGQAGDEAAAYFYAWLFLRQPALRDLFPPAMDEQRDRLFRALARIVESLSTPEELASYLTQLGQDHRKYGVEPAMYDAVGEALIATLRAFAGSAFTHDAGHASLH